MTKKQTKADETRDSRGRFTAGNPGGPGGPRRRACELRRAAEEAVTTEHVQSMVRKAMAMALRGDIAAMRFVSERVMGKPAEAPDLPEPLDIEQFRVGNADECRKALESVIEGVREGKIDRESAKLLTGAIQAQMRVIEMTEFEARIAQLEAMANLVERPR